MSIHGEQILTSPATTENGAVAVGNAITKFRDGFALGFDPTIWDETWINQGTGFRSIGGNSVGASYLLLSMCPITSGMEYIMTSRQAFKFPSRFGYGMSISQRIAGQEIEFSMVGCDANGNVETDATPSGTAISGTVTIASNVATINFASAHPYFGGDRVYLAGNTETRLNVGPVVVTVVTSTQITVPCTLANGTYTAGGSVFLADIFDFARNAFGLIAENTTVTNKSFATKRNGSRPRYINNTVVTTNATQQNTSPYTDAFLSTADNELIGTMEDVTYISRTGNVKTSLGNTNAFTESLPDEEKLYKLRFRVKNLENFSKIVAEIATVSKTASTTGNFTTVAPIGLPNGTYFGQVYGVRDQTNFPNLTATTAITVTGTNTFTAVIGTSSTTSSVGGILVINQGSVLLPGALNFSIQSIVRTNNILTATLNTTASGLLPGEWIHLYGMDAGGAYDGAYKVLRLTGSTVELESVGTNFTSITTGGAIIKRTDVRLHYVKELEYTRHVVELANGRGTSDVTRSIPVVLTQNVGVNQGSTASIGTTGTGAWLVRGGAVRITDIASAAITSTATSATVSLVDIVGSHQFTVDTTAVSGTNPFMRPRIQASLDGGTNYVNIYDFPRVVNSTDKIVSSPIIPVEFTNIRYIRTIGGTSPSFTNSVTRTVRASGEARRIRSMNDIALTLTSATNTRSTEYLYTAGCNKVNISCTPLTGATTAPVLKLQGCNGDPSVANNWFDIPSATITTSASAIVVTANFDLPPCKFVALNITTSAVGTITSLYDLLIQAWE